MDNRQALHKLEELREGMHKLFHSDGATEEENKTLSQDLPVLYGELEEVVKRSFPVQDVEVDAHHRHSAHYSNYIEAALLSNRTIYSEHGYTQLLKVIGKVKQQIDDPVTPIAEQSVTQLITILGRFRECCQYIKNPPQNEKEVQDILWIMLRSQFERVQREETLPTFGAKAYRPDFGIRDLGVLVEVKFVGEKTKVASVQEEILADIPGYLNEATSFQSIVELVYDYSQQIRDPRPFIDDLKKVDGIVEVIVVPGIGDAND